MKNIFFIVFLFLSISCFGQITKMGGIGSRVNDSVTYVNSAAVTQAHTDGYADIWQSNSSNLWWVWTGSSYVNWDPTASGGGGGTWGSITGTLSDQTDLQTALNGKQSTITFGTGVQTALGVNIGSAGAPVLFNGALGTPSSGTLTNATGLPVSTGISGLGSNIATWLATPSSANLRSALTDESGTGAAIFAGGDLGTSTTATTQSAADNSTKVATTAYVQQEMAQSWSTLSDGSSVTWDCASRKLPEAKLTSTQSFTINMTNVLNGAIGNFKLTTNTASAITLTFDTDFTNKRLGAIGEESFTTHTFPASTGREYILSFVVDGSTIHWVINDSGWTSWTPTFTGFSTDPIVDAKYMIINKMFYFYLATATVGVSNSSTASGTTFTLPTGIVADANIHISVPRINRNGSVAAPGVATTAVSSGTVTVYVDGSFATTWSASGQNKAFALQGMIPIP